MIKKDLLPLNSLSDFPAPTQAVHHAPLPPLLCPSCLMPTLAVLCPPCFEACTHPQLGSGGRTRLSSQTDQTTGTNHPTPLPRHACAPDMGSARQQPGRTLTCSRRQPKFSFSCSPDQIILPTPLPPPQLGSPGSVPGPGEVLRRRRRSRSRFRVGGERERSCSLY